MRSLSCPLLWMCLLAAPVAGQQASTENAPRYGGRKVHPLIILVDDDPKIGPTVRFDAQLMGLLFRQQIPQEHLARPEFLLSSRGQVTLAAVAEAIQGLEMAPSDTLFCFYSGPGGSDSNGSAHMLLPDGTRLWEASLVGLLRIKKARLTVFLGDYLASSQSAWANGLQLVVKLKGHPGHVLPHLFFDYKDVIVVNSVSPAGFSLHYQQPATDGQRSLGSVFVREFVQQCAMGDPNDDWQSFTSNWTTRIKQASQIGTVMQSLAAMDHPAKKPEVSTVTVRAPRRAFTNSIGMRLVVIPAGEFMMGTSEDETGRYYDEGPIHRVRITQPFCLGALEVTQREWETVMGTQPWSGKKFARQGKNYPVAYVSWEDAVAFCKKLSAMEGKQYRLPTEAEWEYACRAGTSSAYCFGDDTTMLTEYAWLKDNAEEADQQYAHRVGQKRANAWGLYDMHGNVSEWCRDYYDGEYYANSPVKDPPGPGERPLRVVRGGSWKHSSGDCRSGTRYGQLPHYGAGHLGFRVACPVGKVDP